MGKSVLYGRALMGAYQGDYGVSNVTSTLLYKSSIQSNLYYLNLDYPNSRCSSETKVFQRNEDGIVPCEVLRPNKRLDD